MPRLVYPFLWFWAAAGRVFGIQVRQTVRLLDPWARISRTRRGIRPRRINALLKGFHGHTRYLEIGTFLGHTFQAVKARVRVGVDPDNRFNHVFTPRRTTVYQLTSDEFFARSDQGFDLVFLDGLHEAEQTYRDILNALASLKPGGLILVDDVRPIDFPSSLPSLAESLNAKSISGLRHEKWYGDVYKAIQLIIVRHRDLGVAVFGNHPGGHGQALIWRVDAVDHHPQQEMKAHDELAQIQFHDVFPDVGEPLWPAEMELKEPSEWGHLPWALPTR